MRWPLRGPFGTIAQRPDAINTEPPLPKPSFKRNDSMNEANFITQELLKSWFDYHPDGYFVYKKAGYRRNRIGQRVQQQPSVQGYLRICVQGKRVREHRAIFLWHHGFLPSIIDHINGRKTDNKIENLRAATNSENLCNRPAQKNSTTQFKNIYLQNGKYCVQIKKNKVIYRFGRYKDFNDAVIARNNAIKSLHFEFAHIA
jgi:hypothetical protein